QVLLAQDGDGVGQQVVEEVDVAGAEVGEGVVVDGDAAYEPAEGVVVLAQPGQGAGGADALEGGVQPHRHADTRVDGGGARPAGPGADGVVKGCEVQAQAEVPDQPGLVVGVEQVLQRHGWDDPLPVGRAQPGRWTLAHYSSLATAA